MQLTGTHGVAPIGAACGECVAKDQSPDRRSGWSILDHLIAYPL
jgi:hypothetical protein